MMWVQIQQASTDLFRQICRPSLALYTYAGLLYLSSSSAGSSTLNMYDLGDMILETAFRAARPNCAAPRQAAISSSSGREIEDILEENVS